jgi:hypothetical protein
MQAAMVAILVEKAEFKHETALAIAEAIDVAIAGAGLVTVSILDGRLGELKTQSSSAGCFWSCSGMLRSARVQRQF